MRLKDRVAIITGAGQSEAAGMGNGRATALTFARQGAKLMLANRSSPSMDETARQVRAEGFAVECMLADITKEADCRDLMAATRNAFGRIDILHNNVGAGTVEGDTAEIDLETWQQCLAMNLTGPMLLSKHVLPIMRAQRSGCITHTSSVASVASLPLIAYKAAKSALEEFCRWLAFENGPHNIRCNVLMLGLLDTPTAIEMYHQTSGLPHEEIRRQRAELPRLGRMGDAWDAANAALFLASDAAAYITGAVVPVDGGLTTRVGS
ncbi:MAG: SDR family oxidoreductase [Alphaproteobacteria bacterium]|nr:SDR family oxidoreductase [Alphaproteobacteria bacterium]